MRSEKEAVDGWPLTVSSAWFIARDGSQMADRWSPIAEDQRPRLNPSYRTSVLESSGEFVRGSAQLYSTHSVWRESRDSARLPKSRRGWCIRRKATKTLEVFIRPDFRSREGLVYSGDRLQRLRKSSRGRTSEVPKRLVYSGDKLQELRKSSRGQTSEVAKRLVYSGDRL